MWASQVALVVENPPANAGDVRGEDLIPGLGRPPGGRHDSSLQYPCLENPLDRGAWWATVQGVAEKRHSMHAGGVCVCLWACICTHVKTPPSWAPVMAWGMDLL